MKRPAKRPAAATSSKRPACAQQPAEQARDLDGFPEPNDWAALLPQVSVHRPLVVSMPCVGIDGCGYALSAMGVSYSAVNVYDLESRYETHLRNHLGASCELHLGQVEGDLTKHLYSRGLPCDMLVSGPPCPPWAGNGLKGGAQDARADVFVTVLKYCVHMATMGSLHAVVVENVSGILEKTQQGQASSFMDVVLEGLRKAVPQFDWQVAVLRAQDFRLPQKRTRVFLRGLRRCFGEVPAPLPPMGEMPLEAFLKPNLPPVNRASVTACIRHNLKDAERELLKKWDSGELSAKDIVCFPADRASGKTYARVYQKNMVPTLTTSGMYLFLVSVGCLRKPDDKRRYFRFLDSTERLTLQGFKKDVLASSPDCLRRKASGNAYPVPLVAAVLAPMLLQLSRPELQSELDRCPDKSSAEKAALTACRFEKALVSATTASCNRDLHATHMQQQRKRSSQTSSAAALPPQPKKRREWIKSSSSS